MKTSILSFFITLFSIGAVAQTVSDTVWVQGDHGRLRAIVQHPTLAEGQKCPAVIICHGFCGEKKASLLQDIADKLLYNGVAAIRFDFNAHGESEGAFEDMTVPNEIEDAKCIYKYVRGLKYVSKIAIAGHSQGGVVASMLAGELGAEEISAVALMAPAAVLRDDAIKGCTMGANYDPLNLKGDYVELPNHVRLGKNFINTAFSLPIYETAEKYKGPAYIIHGTGDRIVPYTYGERYHKIWRESELHIIPGENHGFTLHSDSVTKMVSNYLLGQLLYKPTLTKGDKAPDFTSTTNDGKSVSLKDFRGKYVIIDFWATWCGDCRYESPFFKQLYNEYKDKEINGKGIEFISFSFDNNRKAWTNYIEKNQLEWTQISNLKRTVEDSVFKDYKLHWIPAFFIIDSDGTIVTSTITVDGLRASLESLF